MSGIPRLFTDRRSYSLWSMLGKTYIGIGIGVGIWNAKQTVDYKAKYSYAHPDEKIVSSIEAALNGAISGIIRPITLYDTYIRMRKSKNTKNPGF